MRAIVQTGTESVALRERNRPSPGPEEVAVRVHTAGVCGSDVHMYLREDGYEWMPIPRIMGHEYAGTVADVGDEVEGFAVGDPVVEEPIHECGACFQCENGQPNVCRNFSITGAHRDGAYTEYTIVRPEHLHRIPEGVPLTEAAITEPSSVAARAVLSQSRTTAGDTVLVEGPGPIGVLTAVVADAVGANVVVSGVSKDAPYRLPLVESLGLETANVETDDLSAIVEARTDGVGFDVVFDTTGVSSGVEIATDAVRKGGQVVVIGLPGEPSEVFMTPVVRGEIDLNTSYGSTWRNFEQALRLLEGGEIDAGAIIDESFEVEDPEAAFRAFLNGETCKPVFRFADR